MRGRLLAAVGASVLMTFLLPLAADAHPLGNFTINRYSGIEVAGGQVRIHYVVDMAEIPAFQEKQQITDDRAYLNRKVPELTRNLDLEIDGTRVALSATDTNLSFPPGQGGLSLLRLEALYVHPVSLGQHAASYSDHNYTGRLGWKEITIKASGGADVRQSSAPRSSISKELRAYPQDRLTTPLDMTQATFAFVPGVGAGNVPAFLNKAGGGFRIIQDRYASLIAQNLTTSVIALSLVLAVALGAGHALSPGHGKAVMAAYLVGTRRSPRHAVILGSSITVTHTIGVFALGLITLFASAVISPERLYPWLTLVSGLLVLLLGLLLLISRTRTAMRSSSTAIGSRHPEAVAAAAQHHSHDGGDLDGNIHSHWDEEAGHDHGHNHGDHHHHVPAGGGVKAVIAMGISGGLLPCPSALVVLLSAISLHRIVFGIVLIIAFSIGLAGVLTGIGVALATGLPLLKKLPQARTIRLARIASVVGAVAIVVAGLLLTAQALPGVL